MEKNGERESGNEDMFVSLCIPKDKHALKKHKQTYIKGLDRMNLVHDCKQLLFSFYGIGTVCYIVQSTSDLKAELT